VGDALQVVVRKFGVEPELGEGRPERLAALELGIGKAWLDCFHAQETRGNV